VAVSSEDAARLAYAALKGKWPTQRDGHFFYVDVSGESDDDWSVTYGYFRASDRSFIDLIGEPEAIVDKITGAVSFPQFALMVMDS
jgi:hypothetical protein